MTEKLAGDFLLWCQEHRNSPDIINLRWWLEHRTTLGYPGDAEANAVMQSVKAMRDLL